MKKVILLFSGILISIISLSQEPQTSIETTIEEDTIIPIESQRNYFGTNISPLMTGIVSEREDFNVKVNLLYKRN